MSNSAQYTVCLLTRQRLAKYHATGIELVIDLAACTDNESMLKKISSRTQADIKPSLLSRPAIDF